MNGPKVWHEKEVDKVGNSYVGTIYEVRKYPEGAIHRRSVWCQECGGASTKQEALKYMSNKVIRKV